MARGKRALTSANYSRNRARLLIVLGWQGVESSYKHLQDLHTTHFKDRVLMQNSCKIQWKPSCTEVSGNQIVCCIVLYDPITFVSVLHYKTCSNFPRSISRSIRFKAGKSLCQLSLSVQSNIKKSTKCFNPRVKIQTMNSDLCSCMPLGNSGAPVK